MISDDFIPEMTGVGVHLKLIAPELVARGHRVVVITTRRAGEPVEESWQGVEICRVATAKAYGFYQALPSRSAISKIFDACRPQVIHHHYAGFMMAQVCAVAIKKDIPQVATFHFSAEVLTQPLLMRPLRPIIRSLMVSYYNRFDVVVSPSKNLIPQLRSEGVAAETKYISNPVAFKSTEGISPAARPAGFAVLFAGRLGPEKNIGYLLRAFSQLLKQHPNSVLWIAGRGPEQPALEALVKELGIASSVEFLGFLDHSVLARYYKACTVFVLPSLQEAQPLVAMEAMWFGKPVIVTSAIVAADEMVANGQNGYIVNPSSVDDLSNCLGRLYSDPDLVNSLGNASLRLSQQYRVSSAVDAIESTYSDVVARRLGSVERHEANRR